MKLGKCCKSAVNHSNTQIGVAEAEQLGLTCLITLIYDGIDLFSRPTSDYVERQYGANKHLKLCSHNLSQPNKELVRMCQFVLTLAQFAVNPLYPDLVVVMMMVTTRLPDW